MSRTTQVELTSRLSGSWWFSLLNFSGVVPLLISRQPFWTQNSQQNLEKPFFWSNLHNFFWREVSWARTSSSSTEGHLWVPQKSTTLGALQRQTLGRLCDRGWWCDAAPCSTSIWTQPLEDWGKASVGMDWWSEIERTASHLRGWHFHRRWGGSKREGAIKSAGDLEDQSPWFGWREGNQIPWHEHLKGLRWWDQKGGVVCQSRFLHPDLLEKFDDPSRLIPISREQALMEPDPQETITPERVKQAQQHVGELLWLVTRSRPDIMFAVACMGANITKAPGKVSMVASQCRGYLKSDVDGGLRFAPQDTSSMFTLEAFSDASFSPDGEPSHGCLVILLNGSAVFWRSGKQQLTTLSTAECELVEFVNTVTAGESIYVVLQELTSKIRRVGWCDSRAALGILENEGGNWRTRHLRFRSAYVRQLILSGDWVACHVPGTNMIADLGTKALSSVKLKQLKNILGMSSPPTRPRDESDPGHGASTVLPGNQLQAKRIVQILSLVASLQKAAGGEVDPPEFFEDEENKDWIPLAIYTLMVIVVTLAGRILWTWCVEIFSEKVSLNALEESEELEDDDEVQASCSRDEVPARPKHLPEPLSVLPQPDPSEHQEFSGHRESSGLQEVQVPKASQPTGVQSLNGPQGESGTRATTVPKGRGGVSAPGVVSAGVVSKPSMPIPSTGKAVGGVSAAKATQAVPVANSGPVVRTTRYGTVYHTSDNCRFLTARGTGTFRTAQLCESCRAVMESQGREVPVAGDDLKMRAFAQTYHVPNGCNNSTHLDTFLCCTVCNTRIWSSLSQPKVMWKLFFRSFASRLVAKRGSASPLLLKISSSFHVAGDLTRGRYLHDSFRWVLKLWIVRSCFCSKSEKGAIAQIEKCNLALTFSYIYILYEI